MSSYSNVKQFLTLSFVTVSLLLVGCGSDDDSDFIDDDFSVSECSQIGQNRFVFDVMQQWYFWDTSLPSVNPDNFNSVDSLLDTLVANAPEVDRFSYITDQATSDDFFTEGRFVGLGFTSKQVAESLFLAYVFPGSPAAQAGLERGFELVSIDGVSVANTLATGNAVNFGDSALGTNVDVEYTDLAGNTFFTTVVKAETDVPTVPVSKVIDNNGVKTGYLFFYTFIEPSNQALANTFAQLSSEGVTELIVDLRYNGGGLISVANYLAGLIGGTNTQSEVLSRRIHNTRQAGENATTNFANEVDALDLERVVFITSGSSASASELVINSLEPFLEVVLIGDTTFGKPVGQYGFDFCGNTLFPVAFETVNALDQGQYFSGIEPTCVAVDDLTASIGNELEGSLASALSYLAADTCPVVQATTKTSVTSLADDDHVEVIKPYRVLDAD